MTRHTLLLLALCAAPALAADPGELEVVPVPALPGEVPAGSREDQVLWQEARDAMIQGNETIRRANMALFDLHYARLDLDELEKGAAPADLERLSAIRSRLDAPARALDSAMPRGSLGRCRYEILYFEQSMGGEAGSDLAARLPTKRAEARKCRDDHRQVLAVLGPALRDARAALDESGPEVRSRMAARAAAPAAVPGATARPAGSL
jgi:hypothetical protein